MIRFLAQLVNNAPDAILISDREGVSISKQSTIDNYFNFSVRESIT